MTKRHEFATRNCGDKILKVHKAILLDEKGRILFIEMGGLLPEKYDLPGGIVEQSDRSLDDALKREMREELGDHIRFTIIKSQIAQLKSYRPIELDQNQSPVLMTASICSYDQSSSISLPCAYHHEVRWLRFDEVLQHPCILNGIELLTRSAMRSYIRSHM